MLNEVSSMTNWTYWKKENKESCSIMLWLPPKLESQPQVLAHQVPVAHQIPDIIFISFATFVLFQCNCIVDLYNSGIYIPLSSIGKCLDLWEIPFWVFWLIIASGLSIYYGNLYCIYESSEYGNAGTTMQTSFPDLCLLHMALALASCHLGGVHFPFQMTNWSGGTHYVKTTDNKH